MIIVIWSFLPANRAFITWSWHSADAKHLCQVQMAWQGRCRSLNLYQRPVKCMRYFNGNILMAWGVSNYCKCVDPTDCWICSFVDLCWLSYEVTSWAGQPSLGLSFPRHSQSAAETFHTKQEQKIHSIQYGLIWAENGQTYQIHSLKVTWTCL